MILPDELHTLASTVRSVCVMTGAGVSAESGVPTFRGADGLWKKFQPEELANVEAFLANPQMVWEWYSYRRSLLEKVKPNAAHEALASWQRTCGQFTLITQNVDGLHQMAGSVDPVELHGNIRRNHCQSCGKDPGEAFQFDGVSVPSCPTCGGMLRPSVVWFGELLPMVAFGRAERAAKHCDLFVLVGTSGVVWPAASLPFAARTAGAFLLEINPEVTELSRYADLTLRVPATVGVPPVADLFSRQTEVA